MLTAQQHSEKLKTEREAQRNQGFVDFLLSCPQGCNYDSIESVCDILEQAALRYSCLVFYEMTENNFKREYASEAESTVRLLADIKEYLRRANRSRASDTQP